jgi:hypothetical protein
MAPFSRILFIGSLGAMLSLAGSWSGFLVDSDCYVDTHKDTKAGTAPATIDNNKIVRMCLPKADAKKIAIVTTRDSLRHDLDPEGEQKARELIAKHPGMSHYRVNVSGDIDQNTIKVATISLTK